MSDTRVVEPDLHKFGYAPGNYTCICVSCGERHTADKRARRCQSCAMKAWEAHVDSVMSAPTTAETPTMRHEAYMDSEKTFCRRCGAVEGTDAWADGVCGGWTEPEIVLPKTSMKEWLQQTHAELRGAQTAPTWEATLRRVREAQRLLIEILNETKDRR